MAGQYAVYSLSGSLPQYTGCIIVREGDMVLAIYSRAFGPDSRDNCERFVAENCGAITLDVEAVQAATSVGALSVQIRELLNRPLRVYKTGEAITKDFRPERVNIEVSEKNFIRDIWFG